MNVVEELMAQRDAILFGKWVKRPPEAPGEACTVLRIEANGVVECLGNSQRWVNAAVEKLHPRSKWNTAAFWNDNEATREQVLEVLDEAIRMAKEEKP